MPIKRPILLYSLLATLFAISLLYQVRYLPDLFRRETVHFAFFFVDPGSDTINFTTPEAASFGIRNGDHLVAVNGIPFIGTGVLGRAFNRAKAGVPLNVTIVAKDAPMGEQRTIDLPVTSSPLNSWSNFSDLVVEFFLPGLSLLLGFWVAFRRPRDPMAWLLLALMMSFPNILKTFIVEGWPPGWREAGVLYGTTLEAIFPIAIYLFGRFFPEPFPPGSRYDYGWRALQWLCALPFAIIALCGVVISIGALSNYRSVAVSTPSSNLYESRHRFSLSS